MSQAQWLVGESRSGKTQRLVELAATWLETIPPHQGLLLLAANDESKQDFNLRLSIAIAGRLAVRVQTPLGFMQDQVSLFYPLIFPSLNLPNPIIPLRLRPETEQALATRLWQPELQMRTWQTLGISEYRLVRRLLDLMQLAANAGVELTEISERLQGGYGENELFPWMQDLLMDWRQWCLSHGLLTYGLANELFWRYLWPHPDYQTYFQNHYGGVVADDVDDYPAITARVLAQFIHAQQPAALSYNPHGQLRLGLSSDPSYLQRLSQFCQVEQLSSVLPTILGESHRHIDEVVAVVQDSSQTLQLSTAFRQISQRTRGEMLRSVVEHIAAAIAQQAVAAHEIAIIAPGLDNVARYTLIDALTQRQIPVAQLNQQRPLHSSPVVRALLTLVTLILPELGRFTSRDDVAEMLVELARGSSGRETMIDPVRAGLIADYCYQPAVDCPCLLPIQLFPRWDRLGAQTAQHYQWLIDWIAEKRTQSLAPLDLLAAAISSFLGRDRHLPLDRLVAVRELMETAQHFWQVESRVGDFQDHQLMAQFILLLRQGTVSANPYPTVPLAPTQQGVTLSNIFQYRSSKQFHRWHFWLDIGSPLWAKGGTAALYGAPLFLQDWSGQPWTINDEEEADQQRLARVLRDLLCRVGDRLYLCHSDLAVNGQEQLGPLLTLHSRVSIS